MRYRINLVVVQNSVNGTEQLQYGIRLTVRSDCGTRPNYISIERKRERGRQRGRYQIGKLDELVAGGRRSKGRGKKGLAPSLAPTFNTRGENDYLNTWDEQNKVIYVYVFIYRYIRTRSHILTSRPPSHPATWPPFHPVTWPPGR